MANSIALTIGFTFIIAGVVILLLSLAPLAKENKVQTKAAFVGFIGPIPIGFGTNKSALYLGLAIGIVMLVLSLLSFFAFRNFLK
jgi:uncharacterized protein (TIGR00304 family)